MMPLARNALNRDGNIRWKTIISFSFPPSYIPICWPFPAPRFGPLPACASLPPCSQAVGDENLLAGLVAGVALLVTAPHTQEFQRGECPSRQDHGRQTRQHLSLSGHGVWHGAGRDDRCAVYCLSAGIIKNVTGAKVAVFTSALGIAQTET
jgi:hypothetical protein